MKANTGYGLSRQDSADLIVSECIRNGVTDKKQIAYILGTAQHESGNFKFTHEINGAEQAKKFAYDGGAAFAGRGFIQLTHRDNYARMDKALGMGGALLRNPELAAVPEIAAKVLVIGMRDGMFTGKPLSKYINEDREDHIGARRVVNGVLSSRPETLIAAQRCMKFANQWEGKLDPMLQRLDSCRPENQAPSVRHFRPSDPLQVGVENAQAFLNSLGFRDEHGRRLAVDGITGPHTKAAAEQFQRAAGLPATGVLDARTIEKLADRFDDLRRADHGLLESIRSKFHAAETAIGKRWDQASENISAALGFVAKKSGLDRVDAVEFSKDLLRVAAIKGQPGGPSMALAYVAVKEVMKMPSEQSLTDMHALGELGKNIAREYSHLMLPGPMKKLVP